MRSDELEITKKVETSHFYFYAKRRVLEMYRKRYFNDKCIDVLDPSCSIGMDIAMFRNGYGSDINFESISHAIYKISRIVNGDTNRLPFKDRTFDLIISMDTLAIKGVEPVNAVREYHRVLKNNGLIFVNVPHLQKLYSKHDRAVGNVKRYSRRDIHELFTGDKWIIEEINAWSMLLLPFAFLQRAVISLFEDYSAKTDLREMNPVLNAVFKCIYNAEMPMLRMGILPFGYSLFTVCRKR